MMFRRIASTIFKKHELPPIRVSASIDKMATLDLTTAEESLVNDGWKPVEVKSEAIAI